MSRIPIIAVTLLVTLIMSAPVSALEVGDDAPQLAIKSWVKGDAVDMAKGKGRYIYVVEFWATWCPPCRRSIPHLTEMQEKYKKDGVIFIGVTGEKLGKVSPFVSDMGSQMDYTVAVDQDGKTGEAYMKAVGAQGIPHAFIVDRSGKLAWHGNPLPGLGMEKQLEKATRQPVVLPEHIKKAKKYRSKYFKLAGKSKKSGDLAKTGKKVMKYMKEEPEMLRSFAHKITTSKKVKHRDMKLARQAAKLAYDLTEGEKAKITATYARVLFEMGDIQEALEYYEEAVEVANADEEEKMEKLLAKYKKKAKKS